MITRRQALAAAWPLPLAGCHPPPDIPGGFVGAGPERGHLLRGAAAGPTPAAGAHAPSVTASGSGPGGRNAGAPRRVQVLIAGGGIAGLAAARALSLSGVDDFALLELEDQAGGNSRAGRLGGMACPLGAHYLPLPGDGASEVQDLLETLGLRQRVSGRWVYDERHLCHAPQERLFFHGEWQEGLLPLQDVPQSTHDQYRAFAKAVRTVQAGARFAMPAARAGWSAALARLDAQPFATWLDQQGLDDPHLRWYLDYSCRDDYGAGARTVSAWAGLHYFASRHGFHAPGEAAPAEPVLTWAEGNAWLAQRMAAPLGQRVHTGRTVLRIAEERHGVQVQAVDHRTGRMEHWLAAQVVVALPVHVAARVVRDPPPLLREAAARIRHAAWVVVNLELSAPPDDRGGAAPAWDNVLHGAQGLGYVDAGHQRLDPRPGPTVLTWYRALGAEPRARAGLLDRPWTAWRDEALAELATAHPDLRQRVLRCEVARHGHAMAVPQPGLATWLAHSASAGQGMAAPRTPAAGRLQFAHADWSGYSVFEEAFTRGHLAAETLVRAGRARWRAAPRRPAESA